MTTIDFYSNVSDKHDFFMKLSQKALNRHHELTVLVADVDEANLLGQKLWGASPTSFLPHAHATESDIENTPIVIHCETNGYLQDDILVNISCEQVAGFSRFKRLIELVSNDETDKAKARFRYAFYRERGYEIKHIDMLKESI